MVQLVSRGPDYRPLPLVNGVPAAASHRAPLTEHTVEHVEPRFASSNYQQTGPFGVSAEGVYTDWTCLHPLLRVWAGGGILMSRFGILFGARLAPKAPLRFNILLKHLFVCQVFPLFLVFLNYFAPIFPHPTVPPLHQAPPPPPPPLISPPSACVPPER